MWIIVTVVLLYIKTGILNYGPHQLLSVCDTTKVCKLGTQRRLIYSETRRCFVYYHLFCTRFYNCES